MEKIIRHRNNIPYYSFEGQYLMDIIIDNLENEFTCQDLPELIQIVNMVMVVIIIINLKTF